MPNPIFDRMPRIFMNRFREKELGLLSKNGAPAISVPVIFNAKYQPMSADGVPLEDVVPMAWLAVADVGNELTNKDVLTIVGINWECVSCQFDGYGMWAIRLQKIELADEDEDDN